MIRWGFPFEVQQRQMAIIFQTKVTDWVKKIRYTIPTKIEADIPYTSTGPATVNIFAPTPITYPSDLYSIAGDTIEFANPVIGTRVPPPANFPILLNRFRDVRNALNAIKIIATIAPDVSVSQPLNLQISDINCPIEHIKPPNPKCI